MGGNLASVPARGKNGDHPGSRGLQFRSSHLLVSDFPSGPTRSAVSLGGGGVEGRRGPWEDVYRGRKNVRYTFTFPNSPIFLLGERYRTSYIG